MKLSYSKNSKDPTYYIQQGVRNGKKTTTRNVARIGKHSELLAITDDPLAYAKEQVAKYNEEYKNKNKVSIDMNIDFNEKILASDSAASENTSKNIGYFYLQKIYHDLQINDFLKPIADGMKIKFDPNNVWRFLVCSRILNGSSKLSMHKSLANYFEEPDFDYVHILRSMDILEQHYDEYLTHLYERSNNIIKRDTSVCYYDCTNYYFEIEAPDYDYVDEVTGEVILGIRKYGYAKDHKPNPIVEMGLFIDADGIPLSMCLVPGNTNEQTTVLPLEKKLTTMLKKKPFVYCADGGLNSYHIRLFNSMGGKAFVVTQSVKKLSGVLQDAVFNDCDYRRVSTGKSFSLAEMQTFDRMDPENLNLYKDKIYKIIPANNLMDLGLYDYVKNKDGSYRKVKAKGVLKQHLIVTYSRKMKEYQRYIRNRQIERAKEMLIDIDPDTYKKGPNDVTRFIKRTTVDKDGNKIKATYILDEEKIREEEKYDGFYAIATNLKDDVQTILKIAEGRNEIENCFRLIKTSFNGRPVYHHNKERIIAHFMICYTALLIYKLIDKKLKDKGYHVTIKQLQDTLNAMDAVSVKDVFYMALYKGSQTLTALKAVFPDIDLTRKYYQPKELNKIIKKISK